MEDQLTHQATICPTWIFTVTPFLVSLSSLTATPTSNWGEFFT
jgi:hypothetical protein